MEAVTQTSATGANRRRTAIGSVNRATRAMPVANRKLLGVPIVTS